MRRITPISCIFTLSRVFSPEAEWAKTDKEGHALLYTDAKPAFGKICTGTAFGICRRDRRMLLWGDRGGLSPLVGLDQAKLPFVFTPCGIPITPQGYQEVSPQFGSGCFPHPEL